jgi:hypothetical protein
MKKYSGFGFVGDWGYNDTPGWLMPRHLATGRKPNRRVTNHPKCEDWNKGAQTYLCKITVEPVLDSRGRRIFRRVK